MPFYINSRHEGTGAKNLIKTYVKPRIYCIAQGIQQGLTYSTENYTQHLAKT